MNRAKQLGVTYLAVLFLVGTMGLVWASVAVIWSTSNQREREQELLLVGGQFRDAIGQYYEKSPGTLKKYPESLEDLLKDNRQLGTQRYLRKVFVDPVTRTNKWGLVISPAGGIMGVHSLSDAVPIKRAGFSTADAELEGKSKYDEWAFVYRSIQQAAL